MATQDRTILKGYFNTGDKPTEQEFADLIDSGVNKLEDKSSIAEVQAGTDDTKFVTPAGAKASVLKFAPNASETVKGLVEMATVAEAQAGTDTSRAVTPAGAKKAAETFAPVKTVNGIAPVSGNVQINIGSGTDVGSLELGVLKFFTQIQSTTNIFHLKLPFKLTTNNNMFYIKAEGYAYGSVDIIDIVWVGYCYKDGNALMNTKTSVNRSTTITAGQYVGSDKHIYLWLKVPEIYFTAFRLDAMIVGNGALIRPGDIQAIVSNQATL